MSITRKYFVGSLPEWLHVVSAQPLVLLLLSLAVEFVSVFGKNHLGTLEGVVVCYLKFLSQGPEL